MNLKDLENLSNATDRESLKTLDEKASSSELLLEKTKEWERIIHPVDYSTASNFARFGSAEKYYTDTISNIYNTFPYDGSKKERQEWRNNASDLDLYFIDNLYPKSTGYINLGKNVTYSGGSRTSSTPQYILFYGGPNQGTTFDKSNIFDSASNRTSNLSINFSKGNTVEFWFKDNAQSSSVSTSVFQGVYTLFEARNITNTTGLKIDRWNTSNSFVVWITSGSTNQKSTTITISVPNPNNWHHYAFSFITNSVDSSKTDIKFYLDGNLAATSTNLSPSFAGLFDEKYMIGSIGYPVYGSNSIASGSFDEFRFWKRERNQQEIRENMYSHIGGGVNTDDENIDLGVYFKFNEGIVGNTSYDKIILDYSGRISNGTIANYDTSNRNTGSAMQEFNSNIIEPKDPIIYSTHPDVASLYNSYQSSGSDYDQTNTNCLINTLPSWIIETEQEEGRDELVNLFQIVSSYLDSLHIQTEYLSKMRYTEYSEGSYKPYPLYSKFLDSYDFNMIDLFKNANFEEFILNKNKDLNFDKSLEEIKNYIYRNIYNNLVYIYKTKGTIKSFRNLLRCFGIDENILKINIYSNNAEYKFESKTEEVALSKAFIDFNDTARNSMTVFQTASFGDADERSYISGSSLDNFDLLPNTIEAEIVFPYKNDINSPYFQYSTIISSSLFGVHEANEDANILTWATGDAFNFQVYAIRPEYNSKDVKFAVSSSAFGGVYLESQIFKNVYNDEKWNFALRIKNNKDGLNDITGLDVTQNYLLELYGVNTISGEVVQTFNLTKSLGNATVSAGLKKNKRVYIGAHRQDFIGSVLSYSDVKISSLRYWYNYLTNDEINKHAGDASSHGIADPAANAFFGINALRNYQIPNVDTLILNWNFNNITGSDAYGKFYIYDTTSGSLNNYKYGNFSNTLFRKHSAAGTGSLLNSSDIINIEYISNGKNKLPENVSEKELIQILDEDVVRTNKDINPTTYAISFEKSMYQTLSEDMLKLFSSVSDLNTVVGHPVNTIRNSYKDLEYLRRIYFNRISNTPNLEKYIEFYKWIDSSITSMLTNLVPAGTKMINTLSNVVESHILERNKVNFNKINGLKINKSSDDILIPAVSTNNLKYSEIKPPNSPAGSLWLQKRADRTKDNLVTSGNSTVDAAREQIRKAIFYKNTVNNINAYDYINQNIFEGNKDNYKVFSTLYSIKGVNAESQKLNKYNLIKNLYATSNKFNIFLNTNISSSNIDYALSKQKMYASVSGTNISVDAHSDITIPFTIYKDINTGVIYFANTNEDYYNNNQEIGAQGPFTETHVGGNLHRHAKIIANSDRNELYSFDGVSGLSASSLSNPISIYREERIKRPVNIKNIKNSQDGAKLGNYSKAYEVVSVNDRNSNNLDFVLSGGISTSTASSKISLFKERNLNTRTGNQSVIVTKFSTPGAETSGRGANDLDSETFSVYNSINNRNIKTRKYLDRWTAQTWSIDADKPSIHKVYENPKYRQISNSSGYVLDKTYDNGFVGYQIPQSDKQYMWISASTTGSTIISSFFDAKKSNIDISQYITFVSGVERLDFSGLNTLITTSINTSSNVISPINTSSANYLNNYLLNLNGPYQYPSWKQIRGEQKTIVKLYRNNNIITVQDAEKINNNQDTTTGFANTFSSFIEPPFEINYPVKQKIVDTVNNAIIDVVSEYDNISSSFANSDLVSRLGGNLVAEKQYEYDKYEKLYTDAPDNFSLKEAEYKDRIFPRNENLGLIKIRSKPNYMEVAGTGSNGYDRNVAEVRSFWRNSTNDRVRSLSNATASSGYPEPSRVGFDNYLRPVSSSRTDVVFWNNSANVHKEYLTVLTYSYSTKNTSSIFSQDASSYNLKINSSTVSNMSQSSITASTRIVGDLLSYTELETKFFILRQTGTLTDNFYYLYNPSLPASGSNVIVPKPQLFYMNAGPKFIYRNASGLSSSYITVNTGAVYTMTSSGKYPWFDSYNDYFEDIKNISYDKTYLAEYTFQNVSDYYLKEKNGDFRSILSSSYLFLDGVATDINDFGNYTIPTLTTNNFNTFLLNDNLNKLKKLSLKINGIKKLLPYKGFYPAERTIQLYKEFLKSWTGLSLNGDIINTSYRLNPVRVGNQSYAPSDIYSASTAGPDHQLLSLTQPLFAPGILFNSIKSGIAVDWPLAVSISDRLNNLYYISEQDGGNYITSDGRSVGVTQINTTVSAPTADMVEPVVAYEYSRRLPFNSIIEFDNFFANSYFDDGRLRMSYVNPTYYSYSIFSGSIREKIFYPSIFLGNSTSGSLNDNFKFKNNCYKLSMHNFLAEIPNFFLENNSLTTFKSKNNGAGIVAEKDINYIMDIVLSDNNKYKNFSKFGPRNHYGPPNSCIPADYSDYYDAFHINPNMCDSISNYSMAPHSPPYYYGDSIIRIEFLPPETRPYSLKEIIKLSKKTLLGDNIKTAYYRSIFISGTDYSNYNNSLEGSFWTDKFVRDNFEKSINYRYRMPLSSSINIEILTSDKVVDYDEQGYPISVSDDMSDNFNAWIIQTNWECPFISTSTTWDFWTKYGQVDKNQPLTLSIKDYVSYRNTSSLADLVGFEKTSKTIGSVANSKEISEAIVMIPYTYIKNNDGKSDTAKTLLPLLGENGVFDDRIGADINNPSYFYVDKVKINELVGLDISSNKLTLDQIKNRLNSPKLDQNNNIVKTMRSMMDYNLPPHLDWITNKNVDPFVMYIFEFKHNLDQEDLVDIWQGLMPKIARNAELDSVTVEHDLTEYEFFHGKQLPDDIRWKVFKVKKRANTNYYKLTADSKDDARFKFQFAGGTKEPEYSYNWPYDYFSLVEMANIDASIKISDNKPADPKLIPHEKWLKPGWWDNMPKERLGDIERTVESKNGAEVARETAKVLAAASMPTDKPGSMTNMAAAMNSYGQGAMTTDPFMKKINDNKKKAESEITSEEKEKYKQYKIKLDRYNKIKDIISNLEINGLIPSQATEKEKVIATTKQFINLYDKDSIFKYKNVNAWDFDWADIYDSSNNPIILKSYDNGTQYPATDLYTNKEVPTVILGITVKTTTERVPKYRIVIPQNLNQDELSFMKKYEEKLAVSTVKSVQKTANDAANEVKSAYNNATNALVNLFKGKK